ncbi:hypothetical protein EGR_09855 [Echinococcus granulosus]|uniref:Uncharacterized protein n=1 Tax=Echinococcus granulosus TaxID=6210 RepID=W6U2F0_ECHGR|nr:hypothetical protein EGR_09855 [Echinococcus granulosus]EUB55290.1 hypothetical protein EGR_09855 [Echinococcus granulosus]
MPVNATEKSNETDFPTNFTLTTSQTLNETAVSTTEFPEIIVFVNELNPSEPPSLNASSSAKDFNEKFKKAEEVGAIAGGVMAVIKGEKTHSPTLECQCATKLPSCLCWRTQPRILNTHSSVLAITEAVE